MPKNARGFEMPETKKAYRKRKAIEKAQKGKKRAH